MSAGKFPLKSSKSFFTKPHNPRLPIRFIETTEIGGKRLQVKMKHHQKRAAPKRYGNTEYGTAKASSAARSLQSMEDHWHEDPKHHFLVYQAI